MAQKADTPLPVGTLVMIKLTPQEKAAYATKFAPIYKGPWVIAERFPNGKTYKVRDLGSEEERQLTRDQVKVVDIPPKGRTVPELAVPQGAALRDLRDEGDREIEEPMVWLGSPSPSEALDPEGPEPMVLEPMGPETLPLVRQEEPRYALRPRPGK